MHNKHQDWQCFAVQAIFGICMLYVIFIIFYGIYTESVEKSSR